MLISLIILGLIIYFIIQLLNDLFSKNIEDSLIGTDINNLQLTNHYYEYKINYIFKNKDFIEMLDIFIEDIKNIYFKDKYITFTIIFYEYEPIKEVYNIISKPFKFEYVFDHYVSGEMLFNEIIFINNKYKVNKNIYIKFFKDFPP